ncbi:BZIP domain-containing protein [Mycena venus]|uniref:BZIP domain-containing protein n=1 Tax=Mycena venus TaxID=2733690 RepID=A0A8H7CCX0_9AGAR|nr:BZIP domain-containing protein [Mycena venus]
MLVDSPMASSLFAPPFTEYNSQDLNDIFHTELFALPSSAASNSSSPRLPDPLTPAPATSFPDIAGEGSPTPSFFNFLDEDVKALDPLAMLSTAPYDFFGFSSGGGGGGASSSMSMESSMGSVTSSAEMSAMLGIDPQLVGSPAPVSFSDFDSNSDSTSPSQHATSPEDSSPTTIAPVKVGGHGKARKGTVAGGGIKKSSSSSSAATAAKENTSASNQRTISPADWRPPPEVFQKMSSKEKRQLRNKISARNFRVRRKEYISTLEDNIAERDRLLSAIRTELGSTQSENLALRQEIAALKRTLLDNRGPAPVLPPPAPLSPSLGALSPSASSVSSSASPSLSKDGSETLPAAHTLKDIAGSSGSAATSRFWGGAHALGMGGYTSVHTARIELLGATPWAASPFASAEPTPPPTQQENLNPALNNTKVTEVVRAGLGFGAGTGPTGAQADAFGDANPFTVRSLDAYRMHLWGRMAAQYRHNKEHSSTAPSAASNNSAASPFSSGASNASSNNSSPFAPSPFFNASAKAHSPPHSPPFVPLSGLAGGLRPKYFASPTLPYSSSSYANNNHSTSSLAASLAGLSLSPKGSAVQAQHQRQREQQREKERDREGQRERESQRERETAMYAAMASQTLLKKLGGAFWDAFSGHDGKSAALPSSSSASSSSASSSAGRTLDTEKVRKVLEGRAVVRVVDVDPPSPKISPAAASPKITAAASASPAPAAAPTPQKMEKKCGSKMAEVLEESMRSLSLGKK